MVVCHKDRWVNVNSTKLKSTLLPNLFIHILQVLINFAEYPKRTSPWGLQISKISERGSGFFWIPFGPNFSWVFLGNLGQHNPFFLYTKPAKNQQLTCWKLLQKN